MKRFLRIYAEALAIMLAIAVPICGVLVPRECSNCCGNRFHDLALGLDAAYCGRCGAKMDGDTK